MKKKILVIEDEQNISRLVKFILEKRDFHVLQAFDGAEGLEVSRKEKPGFDNFGRDDAKHGRV